MEKSTILIVDDVKTNIHILASALDNDYRLIVANDGREALERVRAGKPDLILLDVRMPGMDGYEVCRRVKSDPATARIPVIFLTSMDTREDEAKGLAVGADDYIIKPFSPAIVQARVRLHLQLYDQNRGLEKRVIQRTAELEASQKALRSAMNNLQTTRVTNGVYWIRVPEAGLYILCGCPAEIVKHLMIRGYISTVFSGDTEFESGPNAILLSDVLIQNGGFANLSEFPILQMLYRQGLIIPNHPNNKGVKPILIGDKDQVSSQKRYIFRGNFGLVSQAEIMAAGIPEPAAKEMMIMKDRFRFGIRADIDSLLDTVVVSDEPVEIRDEVYVRRSGLNRYEFSFHGDTTQVDLNLDPGETYCSPYSLGHHKINREYFAVIHSGEGDGWNPTKPSMGSILVYQGKIYLIDLPPNLHHILRSLGIDISEIVGIFHTHGHDDHFASLPLLLQSDHRIRYYATPLVRASVSKKFSALLSMDEKVLSRFFEFRDLEFNQWNDCDGMDVKPIFSPHPVETNIFIFRVLGEGGYKTYAHYADIISFDLLDQMAKDKKNVVSRETVEKIKDAYLTPATLKKLDAGGGMIHGQATDFIRDRSEKIILAHTEKPLSDQQKQMGSESSFGQCDVLIPGTRNYLREYALRYLSSFFPYLERTDLNSLLNAAIVEFNPGSLILKTRTVPDHLFLILTGTVEYIDAGTHAKKNLSNGCFIGEFNLFEEKPSPGVFRAISHVSVLSFSFDFFRTFLDKHRLTQPTRSMFDRIDFLKSTWLFGEESSYAVQYKIARIMTPMEFDENTAVFNGPSPGLFLIKTGRVRVCDANGTILDTLAAKEFFGECHFFEPNRTGFLFKTVCPTQLYAISDPALLEIPIVHWKLLESHDKRKKKLTWAGS